MDFLFQTNIGSYYTSLIFFAVLSIGCAVLTFLIKREGFDDKFFLGLFLLGTLFFGFWSYQAFVDIKNYNEISKGKVEEYYNIEKVGKILVFEVKKDSNLLKNHFSSTIEEETDSEYILVADDQKVLIPKNVVK
jgi:hypothetical protein